MHIRTTSFLTLAFALLMPLAASATDLRVTVSKEPISVGQGRPLLYVAFDDTPLRADLLLVIAETPNHPLSAAELNSLRGMNEASWAQKVRFTVRDAATHRIVQTVDGARLHASNALRTEEGPHASRPEFRKAGLDYVTYRATVELRPLVAGDYELEAALGSLHATDVFNVRGANAPEPKVRAAYLAREASRAQTFDAYKRLQTDRLQASPNDATILLELGHRAMAEGTLDEARGYFDRAVAVMQENVKRNSAEHPNAAKAISTIAEQRVREVRGLQALLPEFFANRGQIRVEQEQIDGQTRWVLKDRATGRMIRTAP
jgi:hypothetical protein